MKKSRSVLLVLLVLFGIFSFIFVNASVDSSVNNLAKSVDSSVKQTENSIQTTQNFLTKEEVRNQYLKTEWTKLLESKPIFKQIIEGYRKVSPYSDPIVNFLVGMTPEFSLLFILVFVIWFTLVKYYYTVYEALRDLELFSTSTNVIVYGLIFIVLILVQFFQAVSVFLANKIVALIQLILNPWVQVILWIVAALAFIGLSKISKKVVALFRLYRLKSARKKGRRDEIEAREKLIRAAEAASGSEASSSASMRRAREREEMKEVDYGRSTSDEL